VLKNAKWTINAFKIVQNGAYYLIKRMYYTRSKDSIKKTLREAVIRSDQKHLRVAGCFDSIQAGAHFHRISQSFAITSQARYARMNLRILM